MRPASPLWTMAHACLAWEAAPVEDPRALAMALDAVEAEGHSSSSQPMCWSPSGIWRPRSPWPADVGSVGVPSVERWVQN